jgi:hypothetical protein
LQAKHTLTPHRCCSTPANCLHACTIILSELKMQELFQQEPSRLHCTQSDHTIQHAAHVHMLPLEALYSNRGRINTMHRTHTIKPAFNAACQPMAVCALRWPSHCTGVPLLPCLQQLRSSLALPCCLQEGYLEQPPLLSARWVWSLDPGKRSGLVGGRYLMDCLSVPAPPATA